MLTKLQTPNHVGSSSVLLVIKLKMSKITLESSNSTIFKKSSKYSLSKKKSKLKLQSLYELKDMISHAKNTWNRAN